MLFQSETVKRAFPGYFAKSRATNILVESLATPDQKLWLTSEAREASDVVGALAAKHLAPLD